MRPSSDDGKDPASGGKHGLGEQTQSGRRASNSFLPDHDTPTCISTNFFFGLGLGVGLTHFPLRERHGSQRANQTLLLGLYTSAKFHQPFVGNFRTVRRGDVHPASSQRRASAPLCPERRITSKPANTRRRCRQRWAHCTTSDGSNRPCGVPPDPSRVSSVAASSGTTPPCFSTMARAAACSMRARR